MIRIAAPLVFAFALGAGTPAHAQDIGADQACNSNGEINGTLTDNWRFQVRRRDAQLMAQIAGVWRSQGPNGVGGVAETQVTYHPEGTLTYERRTCITMQGLGTSCPVSLGHGYWAAHYSDAQTVFLSSNTIFSGANGTLHSGNCGGAYFRFVDGNTTVDQQGNRSYRVR
jgi:hypothetical protein